MEVFKNSPNSDSVDDSMKFLVVHSTCAGLFSGVIAVIGDLLLDFGPRGKYPRALLQASGSEV